MRASLGSTGRVALLASVGIWRQPETPAIPWETGMASEHDEARPGDGRRNFFKSSEKFSDQCKDIIRGKASKVPCWSCSVRDNAVLGSASSRETKTIGIA